MKHVIFFVVGIFCYGVFGKFCCFFSNQCFRLTSNCIILFCLCVFLIRTVFVVCQRWADCEIFQFESSPDSIKLNPIQPWSTNLLKIISPIQSWTANVKSCIFILPHEAKELLELFCLSPIRIGWRQNTSSSAFASWGKIDTAFWHFQNLTRKCLLGIEGKSTAGVILPLEESNCLDWLSDKDDKLGLA